MTNKTVDSGIILTTQRLVLRYVQKSDIDFLVELWSDPDVTKYVGGPRNKEALKKEFAETARNPAKEKYDLWVAALKETGELVGHAGVLPKEIEGEYFLEVNYFFAKKYWGRGYASEIARGIIEIQKARAATDLIMIIDKDNIGSKNAAAKIGMEYWKTALRNGQEKEIYRRASSVKKPLNNIDIYINTP
jgi:ribosomal-protein-alanine N-acetyltransferase